MSIAAIITVPRSFPSNQADRHASPDGRIFGAPLALCDFLGKSVHRRTIEMLEQSGVHEIRIVHEDGEAEQDLGSHLRLDAQSAGFWSQWEQHVSELANSGIEHLLLVRACSYVELDVDALIEFHRARPLSTTSVHDLNGALDMLLLSAGSFRGSDSHRIRLAGLLQTRRRYRETGYTNHLRNAEDFRGFVRDALLRRCAARPCGEEVELGVWMGSGVSVDPSVRLAGPLYIGDNVRIGSACTVCNAAAIERGCMLDYGSTIDDSSVLPNTYVGVGLSLRNSVAVPSRLYHLEREVELQIADRKLLGSTVRAVAGRLSSSFWFTRQNALSSAPLSTHSQAPASSVSQGSSLSHAIFRTRGRRDGVSLVASSRYAPWERS